MKLIEEAASNAGKPKSHFVLDAVLSVIREDALAQPVPTVVLTEETQIRMAEGVFLLCALAKREHSTDDTDSSLFEAADARAVEICRETQGGGADRDDRRGTDREGLS
ncbi:hypothetical protein AB3X55_10035 [Alphaproteobacteria bacterium LSUCC0719]